MEKVLIVDDEVEVAEFLSSFLKRKGLKPFTANDARKALEIFTQKKPDLILLDVKMPGEDGFFVLKKVKEASKDVKVIMITARDDKPSIIKAKRMGAEDYLIKPIELENLDTVISKYIKPKK
ncbi:MAG: response regulator [Candidatus Omnitrophica bacterium]|nr:response regulator [Candidatus Omnitrophota bacterium]